MTSGAPQISNSASPAGGMDQRLASAVSARRSTPLLQALVLLALLAGLPLLVGSYTLHGVIISMILRSCSGVVVAIGAPTASR